jgi:hypothetical protein
VKFVGGVLGAQRDTPHFICSTSNRKLHCRKLHCSKDGAHNNVCAPIGARNRRPPPQHPSNASASVLPDAGANGQPGAHHSSQAHHNHDGSLGGGGGLRSGIIWVAVTTASTAQTMNMHTAPPDCMCNSNAADVDDHACPTQHQSW